MRGLIIEVVAAFIGFCEGVIVGGAVAAFITILDIVPRLCWLTRTARYIFWYELAIIAGVISFSLSYFLKPRLGMGGFVVIFLGLSMGFFVGMTAAALAEVLDVMPVISRRMGVKEFIGYISAALILGKVLGSVIYWIFPQIWN